MGMLTAVRRTLLGGKKSEIINMLIDGDMELDDVAWADYSAPASNVRSAVQVYHGAYSRQIVGDPLGAGEQGTRQGIITLEVGKNYTYTGWIYLVSGSYAYINVSSGGAPQIVNVTGSWQQITHTFTATGVNSYFYMLLSKNAVAFFDYCWLFIV